MSSASGSADLETAMNQVSLDRTGGISNEEIKQSIRFLTDTQNVLPTPSKHIDFLERFDYDNNISKCDTFLQQYPVPSYPNPANIPWGTLDLALYLGDSKTTDRKKLYQIVTTLNIIVRKLMKQNEILSNNNSNLQNSIHILSTQPPPPPISHSPAPAPPPFSSFRPIVNITHSELIALRRELKEYRENDVFREDLITVEDLTNNPLVKSEKLKCKQFTHLQTKVIHIHTIYICCHYSICVFVFLIVVVGSSRSYQIKD